MTATTMIAWAGSFVSLVTFIAAAVGSVAKRAILAALVFVGVFVLLALDLHSGITLTLAEQTLLWILPGLAAWDYLKREIPAVSIVPLFLFAALLHAVLFTPWMPSVALVLVALPLLLPFWLDRFAVGDRIVVAWLVYALGLLGLVASVIALATCMGRKNAPFVTHLAVAVSLVLVPYAYWGALVGRLAWRF